MSSNKGDTLRQGQDHSDPKVVRCNLQHQDASTHEI